jgi:hypothetical protein
VDGAAAAAARIHAAGSGDYLIVMPAKARRGVANLTADQPAMTAQAFAREFMKPVRCK